MEDIFLFKNAGIEFFDYGDRLGVVILKNKLRKNNKRSLELTKQASICIC
jgi:hypothetical protein